MHSTNNRKDSLKWAVEDLLAATGGTLMSGVPNRVFLRITIDSRESTPRDLFLAIQGERFDGHDFIGDVTAKGVCGIIVNRQYAQDTPMDLFHERDIICIAVDDTTKALGDLAAFQKERSGVTLFAITGSSGKTSTRAMTEAVLQRGSELLATKGNFNNEIGLPLTLLRLTPEHRTAVVEMGMNSAGEIARLTKIARPDFGIITNIGPVHMEGLGSIRAVRDAKGELLDVMPPQATAILNADDRLVMELAERCEKKLLFGCSEGAAVRGESIRQSAQSTTFTLVIGDERVTVTLDTPGAFMVSNALAAASAGLLAGLSIEEIKRGLERFKPVSGRLNIKVTKRGVNLIDDTYNANPSSMKAAIDTLASLKKGARGFMVMGDMLELGSRAAELHRDVGAFAGAAGFEGLFAAGDFAEEVEAGALSSGMDKAAVFAGTKKAIAAILTETLEEGDWVLVKGSRGMAMEEIVAVIDD